MSSVATPIDSSSDAKLGTSQRARVCAAPTINSHKLALRVCAARVSFDSSNVQTLEKWIDALDSKLPQLTKFILPVCIPKCMRCIFRSALLTRKAFGQSGGLASAHLHVARTICRRAEREVIPLREAGSLEESVNRYLNRYCHD